MQDGCQEPKITKFKENDLEIAKIQIESVFDNFSKKIIYFLSENSLKNENLGLRKRKSA